MQQINLFCTINPTYGGSKTGSQTSLQHILWNVNFKEICRPLMLSSLLHQRDGPPPFRVLLAHQLQRNLCRGYAILGI